MYAIRNYVNRGVSYLVVTATTVAASQLGWGDCSPRHSRRSRSSH
ncbi:hypothetical protein [Speluncibacter jeojiensis]|uniref:Uncharacterized protein n=1 Tax=Speluncibacter jeojiensis TaxID=2710754 RepID=A0A9X4M0C4_9ACTN|nr:hypothetical protein [Rhodococcus sp. D2-41]MDG3014665.1 hypothetical protein [Corynebacteriales bacterium D3-21]